MRLSVIICTHNPPAARLERVLAALKAQTLALPEWELIVVDNATKPPLAQSLDLSWHPNSRVVREDELGLTPARLSGIGNTANDLLVFVDDDNLLDAPYLASAQYLFLNQPELGACSGNAVAEFESDPPRWINNYSPFLGIRTVNTPIFTTNYFDWQAMPIGAGLCVRRAIAISYKNSCGRSAIRKGLDRRGTLLISGGDSDLAMTAIDLGFKIGLSPTLTLRHLIPRERCSEDYVVRLMEGITFSGLVLQSLRGVPTSVEAETSKNTLWTLASFSKALLTLKGIDRKVYFARRRGEATFREWCAINQ